MTKLVSLLFSFCLLVVAFELHAMRMEMVAEYSKANEFQASFNSLATAVPLKQLAMRGK